MSKGNMLLGKSRGKVGDVVFATLKGQQITKAYNGNPANPRSPLQMTQRVRLAAPVIFYRFNRKFFPFAFTKMEKESEYNAFIKRNIMLAPYFAKYVAEANHVMLAPYMMTQGTLSAPALSEDNLFCRELAPEEYYPLYSVIIPKQNASIDDFFDAINLGVGDTVLIYYIGVTHLMSATAKANINNAYGGYITRNADNYTINGNIKLYANYDAGSTEYIIQGKNQFVQDAKAYFGGCAVKIRDNNGKNDVSTATLNLSVVAREYYENWRSQSILNLAVQSYGETDGAMLSQKSQGASAPGIRPTQITDDLLSGKISIGGVNNTVTFTLGPSNFTPYAQVVAKAVTSNGVVKTVTYDAVTPDTVMEIPNITITPESNTLQIEYTITWADITITTTSAKITF